MKRVWALGNLLGSWRRDRRYLDACRLPSSASDSGPGREPGDLDQNICTEAAKGKGSSNDTSRGVLSARGFKE